MNSVISGRPHRSKYVADLEFQWGAHRWWPWQVAWDLFFSWSEDGDGRVVTYLKWTRSILGVLITLILLRPFEGSHATAAVVDDQFNQLSHLSLITLAIVGGWRLVALGTGPATRHDPLIPAAIVRVFAAEGFFFVAWRLLTWFEQDNPTGAPLFAMVIFIAYSWLFFYPMIALLLFCAYGAGDANPYLEPICTVSIVAWMYWASRNGSDGTVPHELSRTIGGFGLATVTLLAIAEIVSLRREGSRLFPAREQRVGSAVQAAALSVVVVAGVALFSANQSAGEPVEPVSVTRKAGLGVGSANLKWDFGTSAEPMHGVVALPLQITKKGPDTFWGMLWYWNNKTAMLGLRTTPSGDEIFLDADSVDSFTTKSSDCAGSKKRLVCDVSYRIDTGHRYQLELGESTGQLHAWDVAVRDLATQQRVEVAEVDVDDVVLPTTVIAGAGRNSAPTGGCLRKPNATARFWAPAWQRPGSPSRPYDLFEIDQSTCHTEVPSGDGKEMLVPTV